MRLKHLFAGLLAMLAVSVSAAVEYTGSAVARGNFYLYNIGTGKFLNGGDNTDVHGTKVWLTPSGRYAVLTVNGTGYNIDLGYSSGSGNYFSTTGYADSDATPWSFTPVEGQENVYYISNGDTYLVGGNDIDGTRGARLILGAKDAGNDANNQWRLVTRDGIIASLDYLASFSTSVSKEGIDVTSLIDCFAFDRNDTRAGSWTCTNVDRICSSSDGSTDIVESNNFGCEATSNNFSMYQAIKGLPTGIYTLTVQGFDTGNTTKLVCGDTKTPMYGYSANGGTMDAELASMIVPNKYRNESGQIIYIQPNTGYEIDKGLTIGLERAGQGSKAGWACWDNFTLTYHGADEEMYRTLLQAAIDSARTLAAKLPEMSQRTLNDMADDCEYEYKNDYYSTEQNYISAFNRLYQYIKADNLILSAYEAYKARRALVVALKEQDVYTDKDGAVATFDAAIEEQNTKVEWGYADDINEATDALTSAAYTFMNSVEIKDNAGFDITAITMTNADVWNSIDGWVNETDAQRDADAGARVMGFLRQDGFNLYQSVPVAGGDYRLTVKGFHSVGCSPIYAYAGNLATITLKQELADFEGGGGNDMTTAGAWLDDELNGNNMLEFSTEEGNINIGVKNEFTSTGQGDGADGWTVLRDFKLEYLGNTKFTALKTAYDNAKAAAQSLLNDGTYNNVKGMERTALEEALTVECTMSGAYEAGTAALTKASETFKAAVDSYNAYENMRNYPYMFSENVIAKVEVAEPKTAAEADEAALQYKEKTYQAVMEEYSLDYTTEELNDMEYGWGLVEEDIKLGTCSGVNLDVCDGGQHYSGESKQYYETEEKGKKGTGWRVTKKKTMDLYEGYYVIKFAARSTPQAKCTFKVKTTSRPIESMSMKGQGDAGYGIDTSGNCNYHSTGTYSNDGKGGGWEWIMIPFRMNESGKQTVTFTYSVEAEGEGVSASICDFSVLASDVRISAYINYGMRGTTLSSDQNLDFSDVYTTYPDADALKAYIVKEINGSHAVLEQVTGAIPAKTGLFLLGTSYATYKIKVVENAAPLTSNNYLEPVLQDQDYTEQKNPNTYVYGAPIVGDKEDGFYKVGNIRVPAGKAVLRIPDSQSGARPAVFTFDTPTGVTEVEAETDTHNEPIYNLCGQRVSKPKGLVIKGGKAYLVR